MKSLPKDLNKLIEFFQGLPGIGPKTAKRLGFYLLRIPQSNLSDVAKSLESLKKTSKYCSVCYNLCQDSKCSICTDSSRDKTTIAVVEDVLDLLSLEVGEIYNGVYHVLHGRIDPLNYISPDDIFLSQFINRVKRENGLLKEIIIATNPDTEGEATALYLKNKLQEDNKKPSFTITRLAYGLPIGADLEYADYMTLKKSLEGRMNL